MSVHTEALLLNASVFFIEIKNYAYLYFEGGRLMKQLKDSYCSSRFVIYFVGVMLVCIALLFWSWQINKHGQKADEPPLFSESSSARKEHKELQAKWYIDIKGAIKKPGMYEVKQEMRVWDAVLLAGGVAEEADTKQINFAQRLTDQMVIVVPKVGEEIQQEMTLPVNSDSLSQAIKSEQVNINKASEAELMTLSGIGQKKAQEIIRYREENGAFRSVEQLNEIAGIGVKTIEKLKEFICTE